MGEESFVQLSAPTTGCDLKKMLTGPQQSKRTLTKSMVLSPSIESVQTNHLPGLEPRQAVRLINPSKVSYFWDKVSISFTHNIKVSLIAA